MPDPKATTKEMVQNAGVAAASAAGLVATVLITSWALKYTSTYLVAGVAGLFEQTHYSNLFVKKATE